MIQFNIVYLISFVFINIFTTFIDSGTITAGRGTTEYINGINCVRFFHANGSIGCRTLTREGAVGPIYLFESLENDLTILNKDKNKKYIFLISDISISIHIIDSLYSFIEGILIYPISSTSSFSPSSTTPQGKNSIDSLLNPFTFTNYEWNPLGVDILEKEYNFPILFFKNNTFNGKNVINNRIFEYGRKNKKINKKKFSGTYHAEIKGYFGPSKDLNNNPITSSTCLLFENIYNERSPKCDPIGGQSIWARTSNNTNDDIIMIIASMDARSLGNQYAPGGNTALSAMITMLTVADTLLSISNNNIKNLLVNKRIIFAAFQGEKFGFVGSRRFIYDILNENNNNNGNNSNKCKNVIKEDMHESIFGPTMCSDPILSNLEFSGISLDKIKYILSLDQVGQYINNNISNNSQFYWHINPYSSNKDNFTRLLSNHGAKIIDSAIQGLPPNSVGSFIMNKKNITSAILTSYNSTFNDNNQTAIYNSFNDEINSITADSLIKASEIFLHSILSLLSEGNNVLLNTVLPSMNVNTTFVHELIYCLGHNWTCDLMQEKSIHFIESARTSFRLTSESYPTINDLKNNISNTYYAGVYGNSRQAVVLDNSTMTKYGVYPITDNEKWNKEKHHIKIFPNAYETFIYGFFSSIMGRMDTNNTKNCEKTQDCENNSYECVYPGKCTIKNTFFHNAYDTKLIPTMTPGIFDINNNNNDHTPLWTEPQWSGLVDVAIIFADPGSTIGWMSIFLGLIIVCISIYTTYFIFLKNLQKFKIL